MPPIAAVREGAELPPGRFHRFRTPFAAVLTALGFALLVLGLFSHGTSTVLILLILGTLLVFVGVAMLSAPFIPALAGFLGWPATKIGGAAGTLARDNARRNPQRTASTAAALMIGLALVTLVATLAAGHHPDLPRRRERHLRRRLRDHGAEQLLADPDLRRPDGREVPGGDGGGSVRTGDSLVFGERQFTTAVTPGAPDVISLVWKEGSQQTMTDLGQNGAFVDDGFAKDHHLTVGSSVPVTFITGKTRTFQVKGIFDPPTGGSPFGPVTISAAAWDAENPQPQDLYTFVKIAGGESDANVAALEKSLSGYPNAKVQTRQQFIDNQISGLNSILNILYVLLALSVIVSLFGIVNTLVLTVFERTREIGMLRAIGLTRRQTRRMIRHESVITALIGAFVGIALGLVLAGILIAKVDFLEFSFPTTQVIVFTIAAIIVGILAAIFPARRAAKLNPLEALHYE